MNENYVKVIEVLLKLQGIKYASIAGCRWDDSCTKKDNEGNPNCDSNVIVYGALANVEINVVRVPCINHLPDYLNMGWREL